jgi:hypothetical protein
VIRLADVKDAYLVHEIMLLAFEEYRNIDVPSSALNETIISIEESIKNGVEKALLYYSDEIPLGSVRFKVEENSLYFSRLSFMNSTKSPGGSLYPYYYKGGELHCLKYGSFYGNKDSLFSLMKKEEEFIINKKRRMSIWVDFYKTQLTHEVITEFVKSISRLNPSVSKLSIVGCSFISKWKITNHIKRTRTKFMPIKFYNDPEYAKTWLVTENLY